MLEAAASTGAWRAGGRAPVRGAVNALARRFREAGLATPELDARLIVLDACGLSQEAYILDPERAVGLAETVAIEARAARRLAREPVSRILGRRAFWGHEFSIGPAVLDPRPETEMLVEAALEILSQEGRLSGPLRIIDFGTGSGCILLSLLAELPEAWGVGTDIDPAALRIAAENARQLSLTSRSAFICADWSAGISGEFDVILANPPYISGDELNLLDPEVRRHDPARALDGGFDGFEAYRRIARSCLSAAKPGSWIVLEAGMGQANEITEIFARAGWGGGNGDSRLFSDLCGIKRVVAIKRQTGRR
jgi:release factor glutamine methyltransferase